MWAQRSPRRADPDLIIERFSGVSRTSERADEWERAIEVVYQIMIDVSANARESRETFAYDRSRDDVGAMRSLIADPDFFWASRLAGSHRPAGA